MSINNTVQTRSLHYNNFNLSHTHDTSGRIGKLIPVLALPIVAGDLIEEKIQFALRMSPMSAPAMVRFNVHFHSFYVPLRVLTPRRGPESTWEKFVMNVGNTSDDIPILPHFSIEASVSDLPTGDESVPDVQDFYKVWRKELQIGSLWDYMKLPTLPFNAPEDGVLMINELTLGGKPGINAFNFLAYLKVWNDWYRRDQIEEEIPLPLNLGKINLISFSESDYQVPELPENVSTQWSIQGFVRELLKLRTRNYERDYFTSALPEPQFGDDVTLSGGQVTALVGAQIALSSANFAINAPSLYFGGNTYANGSNVLVGQAVSSRQPLGIHDSIGNSQAIASALAGGINTQRFDVTDVDNIQSTPFSINELRMAFQIQGVREQINRGGTRYTEIMKSVFGVSVNDLRIQRAQYLGGFKAPISIGAVIQTSESQNSPQGTLTGQGGAIGGQTVFRTKRIFEEAGVLLTIMSITPRTGYYGGIPREYLKFDPIDYYVPAFDRLGEQEIDISELTFPLGADPDSFADYLVRVQEANKFGYSPRYSEYKQALSTVTGEFRDSLNNWHVYRNFGTDAPFLNADFIHAEPEDFDRLFEFENIANTSNEHFQCNLIFNLKGKRPMSKYSTPYTLF